MNWFPEAQRVSDLLQITERLQPRLADIHINAHGSYLQEPLHVPNLRGHFFLPCEQGVSFFFPLPQKEFLLRCRESESVKISQNLTWFHRNNQPARHFNFTLSTPKSPSCLFFTSHHPINRTDSQGFQSGKCFSFTLHENTASIKDVLRQHSSCYPTSTFHPGDGQNLIQSQDDTLHTPGRNSLKGKTTGGMRG